MACMLWTVFTWTFKGILCTCRFLWICPYNAIQFLPREKHILEKSSPQKQPTGCESKMVAAIPGCPDRTVGLQKRLSKTEQDILSLRTRIACERASWERKFAELQRKQEALCNQVILEVGAPIRAEQRVDNGDVFVESSSKVCDLHDLWDRNGFLYPTPPWTCTSATGSESCCLPGESARAPSVSWATFRGSQSSTSGWSYRRPITACGTVTTRDTSTLTANLVMVPLYHFTSC
ncbi:uncharacterized protein LOC133479774 isoform X2 [Phyllopteryx taeniolatus]|uniref:uncharacterized protein LOC133479774 isoform X2 n=1 Tax=Phyllopteryx taeniolatus TaxID=161469 RepID=UPI002AD4333F|nr:uncharacterized protein LOC133479774 isoform X2 [Phyllopteryx taeniolatus]